MQRQTLFSSLSFSSPAGPKGDKHTRARSTLACVSACVYVCMFMCNRLLRKRGWPVPIGSFIWILCSRVSRPHSPQSVTRQPFGVIRNRAKEFERMTHFFRLVRFYFGAAPGITHAGRAESSTWQTGNRGAGPMLMMMMIIIMLGALYGPRSIGCLARRIGPPTSENPAP